MPAHLLFLLLAAVQIQRQVNGLEPAVVATPSKPIRDLQLRPPLPAAAPSGGDGCLRPFCNESLNSRLPAAAPVKSLKVRWQAPFTHSFAPANVLQSGDRVLVYGGAVYRLYDLDGKLVSEGRTGSSGMVLDPLFGLFYCINSNGYFAGYRLSDGGLLLALNPSQPGPWPFLARRGATMFNLAVEGAQPWKNEPPNSAVIAHFDLPEKLELDSDKIVMNLAGSAALYLATATVKAAMGADQIVLALPGSIVVSSLDLHPHVRLEAGFTPLALSLDELGRIHLIVSSGDRTALWVMTPSGQRTVNVTLKAGYGAPLGPPIIGYDHRIYLTHSGLSAYDVHGRLLWERWPKSKIAGAGITTDGQLLVSEGELAAYDARGDRRVLFSGAQLVTPPAMNANGDLFVASKDTVYCLTSER